MFVFKVFCFFSHYGDHSVPTWCNLITVDLGTPRQRPRWAVQNASREHPVLGDRNIRCDRWLINHEGTCTVSMGGLPLESALWAGWLGGEHRLSNMSPGHITTATGWQGSLLESQNQGSCCLMFIFSQHTQNYEVCMYKNVTYRIRVNYDKVRTIWLTNDLSLLHYP